MKCHQTRELNRYKLMYFSMTRVSSLLLNECMFLSLSLSLSDSIGCGLDRLAWDKVSVILEQVFKHTNISITVYSLPEKTETKVMKENMRR